MTLRRAGLSLLLVAFSAAGCAHEIVVTNMSDHDASLTQKVEGGEHTITLHPGANVTLPINTPLRFGDLRIDHR